MNAINATNAYASSADARAHANLTASRVGLVASAAENTALLSLRAYLHFNLYQWNYLWPAEQAIREVPLA